MDHRGQTAFGSAHPACDPRITVQPIALFELGSALERISLDRHVIVGADLGYPRRFDVVEQVGLAVPEITVHSTLDDALVELRTLLDPHYAWMTGSW